MVQYCEDIGHTVTDHFSKNRGVKYKQSIFIDTNDACIVAHDLELGATSAAEVEQVLRAVASRALQVRPRCLPFHQHGLRL